jgi:hypothetical protein
MKTQTFNNDNAKLCWLLFIDAVLRKDLSQFGYYRLFHDLQSNKALALAEETLDH